MRRYSPRTGRAQAVCLLIALASFVGWAASGLEAISDVRVAPLIDSHWSQANDSGYANRGEPCFNYLTPNNYRAGCSAVAMAQVMRYWRYPSKIAAQSFICSVDGEETSVRSAGEAYLWDEMPGVTANGTTLAQRQAIGTLLRDCAISLHSFFKPSATTAFGVFSFFPLREVFGYRNAVGYGCAGGESFEVAVVQDSIFASLDAGAPVIVSLCQSDPDGLGHVVIADGYGFNEGKAYVHLNLGYGDLASNGMADAWFELSDVTINTHLFDKIDGVIYNIFPETAGDVLSGRVLWATGALASGAEVTVRAAGKVVATTTANDAGIYAFVLPGGKDYVVGAGDATRKVTLTASVSADVNWTDPLLPTFRRSQFGTLGNSWGNDLTITTLTPPPEAVPEFGGFMPVKAAVHTGVVYDADDLPCGILTLKVGKMSRKGVSSIGGTIQLLDGKKYTIKSYKAQVAEGEDCAFSATVSKFGAIDVRVGDAGFAADIVRLDGTRLSARPADLTAGFPKPSQVHFSVADLPTEINGYPVLAVCTPEGEPIEVNAKGKWVLRKYASPKLKKIRVKDEFGKPAKDEFGKALYQYEIQGIDDPKKPNKSSLKLSYTAKTGMFKGSFALYCNTGKKLAKYSFTVNGLVLDGVGVGRAVCKKPALSLAVTIH